MGSILLIKTTVDFAEYGSPPSLKADSFFPKIEGREIWGAQAETLICITSTRIHPPHHWVSIFLSSMICLYLVLNSSTKSVRACWYFVKSPCILLLVCKKDSLSHPKNPLPDGKHSTAPFPKANLWASECLLNLSYASFLLLIRVLYLPAWYESML